MNKKFLRRDLDYCVEIEGLGGEAYEYEMIAVNAIPGFLPVQLEWINGKERLIYTYTGDRMFEDKFANVWINGDKLFEIVDSLLSAVEDAGRYLLNPDNLILLRDCLFYAEKDKKIHLMYVPGYEKNIMNQFRDLMDYLSERMDRKDSDGILLAWKIHMILKQDTASIHAIKECLKEYKGEEKVTESVSQEGTIEEKRKKRNKSVWLYLLVIFGGLFVLFATLEMYLLFHIYFYGIVEWKRNLLLWNSGLLVLMLSVELFFWKKEKGRRQMEQLFSLKL